MPGFKGCPAGNRSCQVEERRHLSQRLEALDLRALIFRHGSRKVEPCPELIDGRRQPLQLRLGVERTRCYPDAFGPNGDLGCKKGCGLNLNFEII